MTTKVYYDNNQTFLKKLFNGGKDVNDGKGFELLKMLEGLYDGENEPKRFFKDINKGETFAWVKNEEDQTLTEVFTKENQTNLFPCIIVIKKNFFYDWSHSITENYCKLAKFKKICEEIKKDKGKEYVINQYEDYIQKELNRLMTQKSRIDVLDKNLKQQFSFINNSSIWIRLVDCGEKEREKDEKELAKEEFEYFEKIGLYEYGNAKENLEYNLRLQEQNYLKSSTNGHGNYVTPSLYGDESNALSILQKNVSEQNNVSEGDDDK